MRGGEAEQQALDQGEWHGLTTIGIRASAGGAPSVRKLRPIGEELEAASTSGVAGARTPRDARQPKLDRKGRS
jgi:hypothetical protein